MLRKISATDAEQFSELIVRYVTQSAEVKGMKMFPN